jgi:alkyl hydroperoxide reductase subunit F
MFNINIAASGPTLDPEKLYDLLIVGGGPAGLSASIYAARKGLTVGIIADKIGGQVNDTSSVENYIGFEFVTGQALAESFEKHVESLSVDISKDTRLKSMKKNDYHELACDNYMTYKSKAVLIATGSKSRQLNVPGENEFYGKGVSYCAICDGPLFKDKTIVVAGGGNSAVEAAIDLSKIAKKVILVHRSKFRADKILVDKLETLENVEIHLATQIEAIHGLDQVTHIKTSKGEMKTDGVLIEIGYVPNTQFLSDITLNERKEILVDKKHQTNQPGVFAAGDVTDEPYKQIIVAASEGAKAALSINDYLNNLGG